MDMKKGLASLPLYRLYLEDLRGVGDMPVKAFVVGEAQDAFAEFLMQAITRGSNDVGRVHVQVECGSRTVHGFAAHTDTTRASIEAFLDALRILNVTERKEKEA